MTDDSRDAQRPIDAHDLRGSESGHGDAQEREGVGALRSETSEVALAVARGAVDVQPHSIGRYVIIARIGSGGTGVVYSAFDPVLDRKVAVKLIRAGHVGQVTVARLLREAKAMACLNHTNVVAVHDCGEHEGNAYLVMDYIDGSTLRAWLGRQPRSWQIIFDAFIQAARGLAAAHHAGLVHRDFKPDNVLVARDGCVKVTDFGLVRPTAAHQPALADDLDLRATPGPGSLDRRLTGAGSVLGTPAYMAPEQRAGAEVGPAADQFSFCVSLSEALGDRRPDKRAPAAPSVSVSPSSVDPHDGDGSLAPAWLRRVLARGLSPEVDRRWPDMDALIAALERGRAWGRTRRVLVALAALATLAGAFVGVDAWDERRRLARCVAAGDAIDATWNEQVREALRSSFIATKLPYAPIAVEKVMPWIDEYAASWREHTTGACLDATVRGTLGSAGFDRATWCLQERRANLARLLDDMVAADNTLLQNAVKLVAALQRSESCRDDKWLTLTVEPPPFTLRAQVAALQDRLARAHRPSTGDGARALAIARAAQVEARGLGWSPLLAQAMQEEATALMAAGEHAQAERVALGAYVQAAQIGAWDLAASTAVMLVTLLGEKQDRYREAMTWAQHAEIAVVYAGDPRGALEADRQHRIALVHAKADANDLAEAAFQRALALKEKNRGPDDPSVAIEVNNLGVMHEQRKEYEEASEFYERAYDIWERQLGADHPNVSWAALNLGHMCYRLGEYDEAKRLHERSLRLREQAFGRDHSQVAYPLTGLGDTLRALGDHGAAREHLERAVAIRSQKGVAPRLRAASLYALARALWTAPDASPLDRQRVLTLAAEAKEIFAGAKMATDEARVGELWLAAHEWQ